MVGAGFQCDVQGGPGSRSVGSPQGNNLGVIASDPEMRAFADDQT
jgi:hypothetical protein